MQTGKRWLTQFFLWIDGGATVGRPMSAFDPIEDISANAIMDRGGLRRALRSGRERVRTECLDLHGRLDTAIGHDLLNRFQSCFDALHLSAILCGAFSRLLGDQPTH